MPHQSPLDGGPITNGQTRNYNRIVDVFFFSRRRRHTIWTGDWSSDVCSSDLGAGRTPPVAGAADGSDGGPAVVQPAHEEDWETEYLSLTLAVRVVDSLQEAIGHIGRYGSGHSEAIVTNDTAAARAFQRGVDAACVYVNASTRFTDGGEFGMGAEIGNSTQKLHARGPIGLRELCTFKYLVEGDGQVRT